jgi:hypothetical protein
MVALSNFSQRYVAPFLTGVCMAGATVADDVPAVVLLLMVGGMFGVYSFPAGARMIRRIAYGVA